MKNSSPIDGMTPDQIVQWMIRGTMGEDPDITADAIRDFANGQMTPLPHLTWEPLGDSQKTGSMNTRESRKGRRV